MKNFFILFGLYLCNGLCAMSVDTLYNQPNDWISGQHDTLPQWIFDSQEQGVVIAVSDPCMTLDTARKQALQRALFLYSMQEQATVRILSDVFSNTSVASNQHENIDNKILVFSSIQQKKEKYGYEIEKEHRSLFGEVFLKVKIFRNDGGETSKILSHQSISELMMLFTKERVEAREFKLMVGIETQELENICQSVYELKGTENNLHIFSSINGTKLSYSKKGCWYVATMNQEIENTTSEKLQNSFWAAYMSSFISSLLSHSFTEVRVQRVGDFYGSDTSGSENMSELYREKTISKVSIMPQIKGVLKNNLYVDWKISAANNQIK